MYLNPKSSQINSIKNPCSSRSFQRYIAGTFQFLQNFQLWLFFNFSFFQWKRKSFKHSRTFAPQVKSRHHVTKAAQAHAPVLTYLSRAFQRHPRTQAFQRHPEHKLSKDTPPEHNPKPSRFSGSHNYKTKTKQNYLSFFIDRCEKIFKEKMH